jgi:hypothetical protein
MFIPDLDPNFIHPGIQDPGSKRFPVPGSGSESALKTDPDPNPHQRFKYFNPKICFSALGKMIRIRDLDFYHGSRIQGSKRHRIPDPQHC